MLQTPGATSFIGCIGKDKFGEEMKKNSKLAGVNVSILSILFKISPYVYSSMHAFISLNLLKTHLLFLRSDGSL